MIKNAWLLVVLAMSLPVSLFGQGKPTESTSERVEITAPPPPAPSKPPPPKRVDESIISRRSEKVAHFVVTNLIPDGSHLPLMIAYHKGFAFVRNSPQEIPVTLVPHDGHLYAVLKLPGIPPEFKVVKLGAYKE